MGTGTDGSKTPSNVAAKPIDVAYARFKEAYPAYETTSLLSELRVQEYSRLDKRNQTYLDYTGGGLYADAQLRDHMALLREGVFGNPHSTSPASEAATILVERARNYVLEYFNASPEEYVAIFTANATGAIKLVGESYPFGPGDRYLLTFDNHNSINGIREFARAKGAKVTYVPVIPPELRLDASLVSRISPYNPAPTYFAREPRSRPHRNPLSEGVEAKRKFASRARFL